MIVYTLYILQGDFAFVGILLLLLSSLVHVQHLELVEPDLIFQIIRNIYGATNILQHRYNVSHICEIYVS